VLVNAHHIVRVGLVQLRTLSQVLWQTLLRLRSRFVSLDKHSRIGFIHPDFASYGERCGPFRVIGHSNGAVVRQAAIGFRAAGRPPDGGSARWDCAEFRWCADQFDRGVPDLNGADRGRRIAGPGANGNESSSPPADAVDVAAAASSERTPAPVPRGAHSPYLEPITAPRGAFIARPRHPRRRTVSQRGLPASSTSTGQARPVVESLATPTGVDVTPTP